MTISAYLISSYLSFNNLFFILNLLNFGTLCDTFLILELLEKIRPNITGSADQSLYNNI